MYTRGSNFYNKAVLLLARHTNQNSYCTKCTRDCFLTYRVKQGPILASFQSSPNGSLVLKNCRNPSRRSSGLRELSRNPQTDIIRQLNGSCHCITLFLLSNVGATIKIRSLRSCCERQLLEVGPLVGVGSPTGRYDLVHKSRTLGSLTISSLYLAGSNLVD